MRERLVALLAGVLVCAGFAAVAGQLDTPAAAVASVGAGETVLVSTASVPTDDPSGFGYSTTAPVLSGDGLTAAYGFRSDCCLPDSIHVRDLTKGTEKVLADEAQDRVAPSLTSDARLLSYLGEDSFRGVTQDVYVTDLASGGDPIRVTGLGAATGDLPYQRQERCEPTSFGNDERGEPRCGPRLSADGTALVIPAAQVVTSPQLLVSSTTSEGAPTEQVQFVQDQGLDVTLTARGSEPIPIDSVEVVDAGTSDVAGEPPADEVFTLAPPSEATDCNDRPTLTPDDLQFGSCSVEVTFSPPPCTGGLYFGRLLVHSPVTGGETETLLYGRASGCASLVARARAIADTECPGEMPVVDVSNARQAPDLPDEATSTSRDFFETQVGGSEILAQTITNTSDGPAAIGFETADCSIRLVTPGTGQVCSTAELIPAESSCTAYIRFAPGDVHRYGAMLTTSRGDQVRFFGTSTRQLVLLKRDASRSGAFLTQGSIVNVGQQGDPISGSQPAISADGRFVSFTTTNFDATGAFQGTRVVVRDTVAGRTTLASVGVPANRFVSDSSISGDGNRVAYRVQGDFQLVMDAIQVRDFALGRTVTASPAQPANPGDFSTNTLPALSLDGSTVAFVSDAADLMPPDVERVRQVFARDLGPDFGGPGTPAIEWVSAPQEDGAEIGRADSPSVDETGASVVFDSDGDLVADPPPLDVAVYARHRFGSTVVAPTSLTFADQPVGTTGPTQAVTVRNDGPGPSTVTVAPTGPFALTDHCAGVVLHRGESCTLDLASAPTVEGPQSGDATVTTGNPVWSGIVADVALSGNGTGAQLLVAPATLDFAPQVVGIASRPILLTVTNLGHQSMEVTAALGAGATDYVLSSTSCPVLTPGASCQLPVRFKPSVLGARPGRVDVSATVGPTVLTAQIPATGTTAPPTLTFSPTVVQEGRVTFLQGDGFLPGVPVLLQWSVGLSNVRQVVPDAAGRFETPIVVLTGAPRGQRILTMVMPGIGSVQSEPLLVVSRSAQPPDFERD